MRNILLIAVFTASSVVAVGAQQTIPPPPSSAPPTMRPPSARPPAAPAVAPTRPPSTTAPTAAPGRVPAPPSTPVLATSAPQATPPRTGAPGQTAPTPRPGQTAPAAPTPVPFALPSSTWQNVRIDVKISDSLNLDNQTSKSVSLICLDSHSGQVRSQANVGLINIDARPSVRPDGRIWLQLTMEYTPELTSQQAQQAGPGRVAGFSESLNLLVTDGKPIVASQSADPKSDRKVSVEITATIVK